MNDDDRQSLYENFESSSERQFLSDKAAVFLKSVLPPIDKIKRGATGMK